MYSGHCADAGAAAGTCIMQKTKATTYHTLLIAEFGEFCAKQKQLQWCSLLLADPHHAAICHCLAFMKMKLAMLKLVEAQIEHDDEPDAAVCLPASAMEP
jgi:hypothetical protein